MTRISTGMDYKSMVDAAIALGIPRELAERSVAAEIARRGALDTPVSVIGANGIVRQLRGYNPTAGKLIVHVGADRFAICRATIEREFDQLRATFYLPPRTKKNGTMLGIRQSPAYVRYREAIKFAVKEANDEFREDGGLGLPMPDQHYNLAAIYYVDKPGERADLFGLHDGIADALQDAGVISNDWLFRTADGSRVIPGDPVPRVEITITPIEV